MKLNSFYSLSLLLIIIIYIYIFVLFHFISFIYILDTQLIDDLLNDVILSTQSIKNQVDNGRYQHALDIIKDCKSKLFYIKKTKDSLSEKVELIFIVRV